MSVSRYAIPDEVLKKHLAIVGMTGSGKTSTEKVIIEQVVATGSRVCILDPVKSDHWGLTSSASGKSPGLPFKILGGPRGHVPLHSSAGKAIGHLVGQGKLPLSIIDMSDFEAGGLQQFFVDFVPSLMKSMKGVLYLVIEEAHEFAPKEMAGFNKESMGVHYAKKLATASRSRGIRLIVATQRVQSLHNAVLSSCPSLIAMQLAYADDQAPVTKWLKGHVGKDRANEVEATLASLPVGEGWIASGALKLCERVKFPLFKTYDNNATPEEDAGDVDVKTAAVDQAELKEIIGDALKEAEANDPKALRAEIVKLKGELSKKPATISQTVDRIIMQSDPKAIASAEQRGIALGRALGAREAFVEATKLFEAAISKVATAQSSADDRIGALHVAADAASAKFEKEAKSQSGLPAPVPPTGSTSPRVATKTVTVARTAPSPEAGGDGSVTGPERRILDSLGTWRSISHSVARNAQVAWLAGYSPTSTSYTNPRGALSKKGLVSYPSPDRVALTEAGAAIATADPPKDLCAFVLAQLPGPEARILRAAMDAYPTPASNDQIATTAGYSASSTSYTNPRGSLKSKELITYPSSGMVLAADWLF